MKNQLIESFKNEKRWVNWVYKKVGDKQTKMPLGSSTDPETWSLFTNLKLDKDIGIVFTPDEMLLGIDIDHCLENGELSIGDDKNERIWELLKVADTYCEISPSGTGLHLFLKIEEPLKLIANRKDGFEAYTSGRFFTVTAIPYGSLNKPVRLVSKEEALEILEIIGYPWGKGDVKEAVEVAAKSAATDDENELSDEDIMRKMFKAKNGDVIEKIWNGDTSMHDNDTSIADMALLSHLAFWTGKRADQIERLWMSSPIGHREKTMERKDYRDRSIANAIAKTNDIYKKPPPRVATVAFDVIDLETGEVEETIIDLELLYEEKGKDRIRVFTYNAENMARILRRHPKFKGRLRFDLFKQMYEFKDLKDDLWRPLEDTDMIVLQTQISIEFPYFQKVTKNMVYDAMLLVSRENRMDSAVDYVKSLEWDGEKRLDSWLHKVYGVADDVYHQAVGSNWMKGLVKRIMHPGCKFDYVLVLEGAQGSKKSTSLGVLGRDWHVETTMGTESKDFFMQFSGKAIIEFSEGETLSRTEVKRMKAIITTQFDKYRPPYERVSKDFPRRCVFAMTTNQTEYLKDETGNRRWLPVAVQKKEADVEWLETNRDQLFAETYQRVIVDKEKIYEFPEKETLDAQSQRRIVDPNGDEIADWYFNRLGAHQRADGITVQQVYQGVFSNGNAKLINRMEEMNIAGILKDFLGLENKRVSRNGLRTTRWMPKDLPEVDAMPITEALPREEKVESYAEINRKQIEWFDSLSVEGNAENIKDLPEEDF